ncbi:MAG: hypothetical protein ACFB11_09045 [Paracoccaceae bacterium]
MNRAINRDLGAVAHRPAQAVVVKGPIDRLIFERGHRTYIFKDRTIAMIRVDEGQKRSFR